MINAANLEKDRRRFDIGSGISLELLDQSALEFIFHDQVRSRILGDFAKEDFVKWNEEHGVGKRDGSQEVMFLGVSPTDKIEIRNILKDSGSVDTILTLQGGVTYEFATRIIDQMVRNIGKYIYLATAMGYTSNKQFITDHSLQGGKVPTKKLTAQITKDTGQSRILAFSYDTGVPVKREPDSHPGMIRKSDADKIAKTKYSGVFAAAKRTLDILGQ